MKMREEEARKKKLEEEKQQQEKGKKKAKNAEAEPEKPAEEFGLLTEIEFEERTGKDGVSYPSRFIYSGKLVTSEKILAAWESFLARKQKEKVTRKVTTGKGKHSRSASRAARAPALATPPPDKPPAKQASRSTDTGWHARPMGKSSRRLTASPLPAPPPATSSSSSSSSSSSPSSASAAPSSVVAAHPDSFYNPLSQQAVRYGLRDRRGIQPPLQRDDAYVSSIDTDEESEESDEERHDSVEIGDDQDFVDDCSASEDSDRVCDVADDESEWESEGEDEEEEDGGGGGEEEEEEDSAI
jgi:hypothetical protein